MLKMLHIWCFSLIRVTICGHLKGRILSLAGMIASPAHSYGHSLFFASANPPGCGGESPVATGSFLTLVIRTIAFIRGYRHG